MNYFFILLFDILNLFEYLKIKFCFLLVILNIFRLRCKLEVLMYCVDGFTVGLLGNVGTDTMGCQKNLKIQSCFHCRMLPIWLVLISFNSGKESTEIF